MERLFAVVLESSFYGAIVGLAILLSKRTLKDKLNARWHLVLWVLLLVKLVFPFGPESSISLFNLVPAVPTPVLTGAITPLPEHTPGTDAIAVSPLPTLEEPAPAQNRLSLARAVSYTWAGGVVVFASWLLVCFFVFHHKLRYSQPCANSKMLEIFAATKQKMRVKHHINILISSSIESPSLFGLFWPRILLPTAACGLSDKELEYILLHELAHFRRKDALLNYLLLAIQAIHWFNPVIWYLFKCVRQDMELATDEMALTALDSTEYKEYGRALLTVLASFSEPKLSAKLLYMADNKENIERRINMIRMADLFKRKGKTIFASGILCLAVLGAVLLTNGVSRGNAAIKSDLIEVSGYVNKYHEGVMWPGQAYPLFVLDAPSDIGIVTKALQNSVKIQGILDVASPHYEIKLQYVKNNAATVFLWLYGDSGNGTGMIMFSTDTHTGYSLTKQDATALIRLFASKSPSIGEQPKGKEALTMSVVEALANGEISPVEVVSRYEGRDITSGIHSFYSELPDEYALMIGYVDIDEPLYIRLIDTRTNKSVDLTPSSLIHLLNERKASLVPIAENLNLAGFFYKPDSFAVESWGNHETARNVGTVLQSF